jgi:hypothetical protein
MKWSEFSKQSVVARASCHRRSYHEIQFITIKGLDHMPSLSDVTGTRISINLTRTGSFSCSNPLITRIYDTTINNYLGLTTGLTCLQTRFNLPT